MSRFRDDKVELGWRVVGSRALVEWNLRTTTLHGVKISLIELVNIDSRRGVELVQSSLVLPPSRHPLITSP